MGNEAAKPQLAHFEAQKAEQIAPPVGLTCVRLSRLENTPFSAHFPPVFGCVSEQVANQRQLVPRMSAGGHSCGVQRLAGAVHHFRPSFFSCWVLRRGRFWLRMSV
jgi:hypothetical protein